MKQILKPSFFARPAPIVAEDLIGKYLIRKYRGKEITLIITETEAYDGPKDKACHGRFGKTERNAAMFGPAGIFYVYFVYGMYWMLNIVTGPENYPAAVLIRGVEGIKGPGRLTKELKITGGFTGKKAVPEAGLWFEEGSRKSNVNGPRTRTSNESELRTGQASSVRGRQLSKVIRVPRIGVDYAGPVWSKKPYRFLLDKNID